MHPLYSKIIAYVIDFALDNRPEIFSMLFKMMLVKLVSYHCQRQCGCIDRKLHLFKKIRNRTDMVLVRMSDYDTNDLFAYFTYIGKIGHKNIYAVHLLIGKAHSHIYQNRLVVGLNHRDIAAYLSQTAEWSNTNLVVVVQV